MSGKAHGHDSVQDKIVSESEYARPATADDLKSLVASLNANGVEYLLIGGYALYAHGYQRATTDIDILVQPTIDAGKKVRQALLILPDKAAADIDPAWFEDGDAIRVADDIIVDVMFNACGETFETLKEYSQIMYIDGIPVSTVSLEGLLLTKKTVREKDVSDRLILERAILEMEKTRQG
jgi:predicted nucleotidyltransferase